jgi:hypothetical protein
MAVNAETEVKTPDGKPAEDWMSKRWRPMMGWLYMGTCTVDFIVFPIVWSILQAATGQNVTQWNPITLQGAGLYHLAMGAICGVAAWSRGQEKMAGGSGMGMGMGGMGMGGGMGMSRPMGLNSTTPTSSSYGRTPASSSKSVLPDTDMEDADNMIRRR